MAQFNRKSTSSYFDEKSDLQTSYDEKSNLPSPYDERSNIRPHSLVSVGSLSSFISGQSSGYCSAISSLIGGSIPPNHNEIISPSYGGFVPSNSNSASNCSSNVLKQQQNADNQDEEIVEKPSNSGFATCKSSGN